MAAEKADVLLIGPPKPVIVNGLSRAFNLVNFPDGKEREKFFDERGPRVRAMARTRGPRSSKNFSRSFPSGKLTRLKARESPLTMTGFGGPISRTSAFSAAMIHP